MYDIRQYNSITEEQKNRRTATEASKKREREPDSPTAGRTEDGTTERRQETWTTREREKNRRTCCSPCRSRTRTRKEEQKTRHAPAPQSTTTLHNRFLSWPCSDGSHVALKIESSNTKTDSLSPISDSPGNKTKKQRVVKKSVFLLLRACACNYYIICDFLRVVWYIAQ